MMVLSKGRAVIGVIKNALSAKTMKKRRRHNEKARKMLCVIAAIARRSRLPIW